MVVDDGSTDDTWDYLKSLSKVRENLVIARHEKNLGLAAGRKTSFNLAKGVYVLFLDSDDLLLDFALEKAYKIILEKPSECYIISVFIEKNKKRKVKIFPETKEDPVERLNDFLHGRYADALYLFKREIFTDLSFLPNLRIKEDLPLKGLLFALTKPFVIKEPLAIIRDHPERLRKNPELYQSEAIESVEVLFNKLSKDFHKLWPVAKGLVLYEIGIKLAQSRKYKNALEYYKKAIKIYPELKKNKRFVKKYLKSLLLSYVNFLTS